MGLPKPETARLEPRLEPRPEFALRDLRIRLIMIPAFGIVIPQFTGLFGALGPRDGLYWLGYLWFTALSFRSEARTRRIANLINITGSHA